MKSKSRLLVPVIFIATAVFIFLTYFSEPSLSDENISDDQRSKIAEIMEAIAVNGQFSGTLLVSVRGEIIYTGAFGLADIEREVPNSLDTQFRIASATKPFTALLIYQLVALGRLNLTDKLTDWIPEYSAEGGKAITVAQLLVHRSGITGEGRIPELENIERHRWTREELIKEISNRDLVFEPGTGWEYSNYGYILLGIIIERAGGATYADQLQNRICGPANMTRTRADNNDDIIPGRALGYHFDYIAGPQNAPYLDMSFIFGAGHLLSTVTDLFRFAEALDNPKILPTAFRDTFFNECGWRVQSTPVGRSRQQVRGNYLSGSINGFASHILRIEKDEIFIALLKNLKEPGAQIVVKWPEYVTSRILAVLYQKPFEMPKKSAAFEVFKTVKDKGIEAGRSRYAEIASEVNPDFYFDENEFLHLSEVLPLLKEIPEIGLQ